MTMEPASASTLCTMAPIAKRVSHKSVEKYKIEYSISDLKLHFVYIIVTYRYNLRILVAQQSVFHLMAVPMGCVFNLDTALVRVAGMEHDVMKVYTNNYNLNIIIIISFHIFCSYLY